MSSNQFPLIILNNPLMFMDEEYLKQKFLTEKYSKGEIISICQNEIPIKMIFKFSEEPLIDQFLSDYNDKQYSAQLNYKLSLTKEAKSIEEIKKEYEDYKKLEPFPFYMDYENEWKNNYTIASEKSGLLYINEESKKIGYEAVKYLINKFSQNLLTGKSILNISLPVFMFDKRTLHMAFAYEQRFATHFLTKAAFCIDKLERIKWVTTYLISCLHMSVIQIKPFNPIIGETFQCRVGSIDIYIEQTVNHPITSNVYCKDIYGNFTMYGYLITDATLAINILYSTRLGKFYIKFKDGTLFQVRLPPIFLKGLSLGDRLYNYYNKSLVQDLTNKLTAYIEMNPDEPGYLASFFTSKKTLPDYFRGKIVDAKDVTPEETCGDHKLAKNAKSYGEIEGEWTSYISFDNVEYWSNDKTKSFTVYSHEFTLPSDGRYREDLINLIKGDQEKSQTEKENLEVRQRKDRKLRADYAKNKK
jgi:hypothetical protein